MEKELAESLFTNLWPSQQIVATTGQLNALGLSTRALEAGVRYRLVHRMRRGVYIPMHQWQDQPLWVQDKLALMGHLVQATALPVYSHFSAARLHGLNVWNCSPLIHLSAGYNTSASTLPADVVLHKLDTSESEFQELYVRGVGMVRLTSLRQTVLDCATIAPLTQAVVIGDSALNKGLVFDELEEALAAATGRRGVQRARRAIAAMNALSESAGESRTRLIIAELPIEQPEMQIWLEGRLGRFRVDFMWRKLRLILEFDGNIKYLDFQLSAEQALIQERERENELIEQGWRFIRIKWAHLNDPDSLKERILRAYWAASAAAA